MDAIEAETDNDREWIPSPKQTCVFPQLQVTAAMVAEWRRFLSEAEDILLGKKLIPHYFLGKDEGINLRRVFLEPREFDLVLWIHGSAAVPYLEREPSVLPPPGDNLNASSKTLHWFCSLVQLSQCFARQWLTCSRSRSPST